MNSFLRNSLIIILAVFLIMALLFFNNITRNYFNEKNKIINQFQELKTCDLRLNFDVLKMSISSYTDLDSIRNLELKINNILNKLQKEFEKNYYINLNKSFFDYKKSMLIKINNVYKFESLMIPIKNADIYLLKLLAIHDSMIDNKKYKKIFIRILSNIFMFEKTLDTTFISNLKNDLANLNKNKLSKKNQKFNKAFMANIDIMINRFPKANFYLNKILKSDTSNKLLKLQNDFFKITNEKLVAVTIVSSLLILFILFIMGLVLYLFYKLDKENILLDKLLVTDDLTKLYNRRKFKIDIEKIKNPVLLIVNIDRFKYYNDLYGIEIGDFILKEVAKILKNITNKLNINVYRFGADDFGILAQKDLIDVEALSKEIINYFKTSTIKYKNLDFNISVSIGISEYLPLIETADMALKKIKSDRSSDYMFYKHDIEYKKTIKDNMKKLKVLKTAIENDNIIPYFQPIWDNKTGKVIKYEVLARVVNGERVESIYPYLNIAKENRLYKFITKSIYEKSFEKFKNKNIEFSLNLSIADIEDSDTMNILNTMFEKYSENLKYLTFEILEDDAIKNYDSLKKFIDFVKLKGCKIALDDFGSGYSNFAHVLNLDIDFLKIDGSLIKYLPEDERMQSIVETIVGFSKKMNIKTIAEFVANKEIYEKVKELNIDYTQGFYLGEPLDKLVGE
jgi:diguanylate cyclase (GGDEF)-like protein